MTATITANSLAGQKPPSVPFKEDSGEFYDYIMYFDDNRRIAYADDLPDLIELLIPKYGSMDSEQRLDARLQYALRTQASMQALTVASLTTEEKENMEDWEIDVLRGTYNEERPYAVRDFWREQLPEGVDPDSVDPDEQLAIWSRPQPLILIDVAYDPWTDIQPPLGNPDGNNVLWIRPADEYEFLDSLNQFGAITFGARRHRD